MPGVGDGERQPFLETDRISLAEKLAENFEVIKAEYEALIKHSDRWQSITGLNEECGWQTMPLFYNGHKIEGFPYELCPVTLEVRRLFGLFTHWAPCSPGVSYFRTLTLNTKRSS